MTRFRQLCQQTSMRIAIGLTIVICLLCFLAPLFGELQQDTLQKFYPPSSSHWFGTDALGRDLFLLVLYGGQISISVGISVMLLSTFIGGVLGVISGWFSRTDPWIMRLTDAFMSIPSILLAIALLQVLEPSVFTIICTLTLIEVPRFTRIVRSSIIQTRHTAYVDAARLLGSSTLKIIRYHLLPPTLGPVLVHMSFTFTSAILMEALLGFLGLGISQETPSWGNIIAQGQPYFAIYPWLVLFPSLFLSCMILIIHSLGDHLRTAFNPKFTLSTIRKNL